MNEAGIPARQRDKDDIIVGIQQGYDCIAASVVRTAQDVYDIRNLLNAEDDVILIALAHIRPRQVHAGHVDALLVLALAAIQYGADAVSYTQLET